ncbi:MAG: NAD(P)-dependent oxidoreductase [Planctomycetes bacterium]|nr:NAD(P)-dependent oxidoreductase [Planctomycetota bacterium]
MKVFVTGHKGYIGSHLVDILKQEGHTVVGCDLGLFDGCAWEKVVPADIDLVKDTRKLEAKDIQGCDAIMHLAALSNDPMGALDGGLTLDVNRDASVRLAKLAKQVGVPRFLFAGSCSVYGKGVKLDLDESDPLQPLTAYAQSKIESEIEISKLASEHFSPVFLRNSTAYGHSPMLRIDLVVNNLIGSALAYGEIRIQSDGSPWRPLIHCRDIARAFAAFSQAPRDAVHNKAVNVGANKENFQVRDVGNQVERLVPSAKITYTGEVGADPRNYRVKFDMLGRVLPGFKLQYSLQSGMEELHKKMVDHKFSKADFEGEQFVRLRTLKNRMQLLR